MKSFGQIYTMILDAVDVDLDENDDKNKDVVLEAIKSATQIYIEESKMEFLRENEMY